MIAHNSGCDSTPKLPHKPIDLHLNHHRLHPISSALSPLRSAVALNLLDMIRGRSVHHTSAAACQHGWPAGDAGLDSGSATRAMRWPGVGGTRRRTSQPPGAPIHFLRRIYPGKLGRYLSFLFLFQLLISAPLSVASGAIGLSQYAGWLVPSAQYAHTLGHVLHLGPYNAATLHRTSNSCRRPPPSSLQFSSLLIG